MAFNVIGIDPSLNSTGLVTLRVWRSKGDRLVVKTLKIMTISPKVKNIGHLGQKIIRIDKIVNSVGKLIDSIDVDYPNDNLLIAIEGYSMASRGGRAFDLGELGGLLKSTLRRRCDMLAIIAPGTWKKLVFGKGNINKREICKEAYKRFMFEGGEDVTDAFGIGYSLVKILAGCGGAAVKKFIDSWKANVSQIAGTGERLISRFRGRTVEYGGVKDSPMWG